jgi:hypothetical protein
VLSSCTVSSCALSPCAYRSCSTQPYTAPSHVELLYVVHFSIGSTAGPVRSEMRWRPVLSGCALAQHAHERLLQLRVQYVPAWACVVYRVCCTLIRGAVCPAPHWCGRQAQELLQQAAEQGDAYATFNLGYMHYSGLDNVTQARFVPQPSVSVPLSVQSRRPFHSLRSVCPCVLHCRALHRVPCMVNCTFGAH